MNDVGNTPPSTALSARLSRSRNRWAHRIRVLTAMALLTIFGLAQRLVPMPRWSWVLGRVGAVPDQWLGHKAERLPLRPTSSTEIRVARAVARGSRFLPWSPTCLAEAAAGQVLLRGAGSPGVVVIGLRRTDPNERTTWDAHAWLLGTRGAITGGPAAAGFTATTVYEVDGGLKAADVDLIRDPRSS